jgi:2-phospho-L-lactate guanylyltransferase (CobY/MobA/RfbA family)
MSTPDKTAWTTESEIQYVRTIGESIKDRLFERLSFAARRSFKKMMLKKYIDAAEFRKDWGLIDKGTVVRFATAELRALER